MYLHILSASQTLLFHSLNLLHIYWSMQQGLFRNLRSLLYGLPESFWWFTGVVLEKGAYMYLSCMLWITLLTEACTYGLAWKCCGLFCGFVHFAEWWYMFFFQIIFHKKWSSQGKLYLPLITFCGIQVSLIFFKLWVTKTANWNWHHINFFYHDLFNGTNRLN